MELYRRQVTVRTRMLQVKRAIYLERQRKAKQPKPHAQKARKEASPEKPTQEESNTSSPPTAEFRRFTLLPKELQLMVLENAIQPRIVPITKRLESPNPPFRGLVLSSYATREFLLEEKKYRFAFVAFVDRKIPILICPKTDVLYFEDWKILRRFLKEGGPNKRKDVSALGLRRLAVGYVTKDHDCLHWNSGFGFHEIIMKAISWFTSLESVVLVDCNVYKEVNKVVGGHYLKRKGDEVNEEEFEEEGKMERKGIGEHCLGAIEDEIERWDAIWNAVEKANSMAKGSCKRWLLPEVEVITKAEFELR